MPEHQTNPKSTFTEQVMNRLHKVNELYDGKLNKMHHLIYTTDISTDEFFTFRNAMKQEDKLSFIYAMEKEITEHKGEGRWSIFHHDTLPNKARPIKSIWYFKQKRKPDAEMLKHKSQLCAHGGMQKLGDSYWETYSPVVNMLSVCLILSISKTHNLNSKYIDFVLVFPQSDLEEYIWMKLPIGFQVDGQTEDDSYRQYFLNLYKII